VIPAARLPSELVAGPAALVTAGAVLVLVAGVLAGVRAGTGRAGAVFAAHTALALELLVAAGLIRLAATDSLRALGTVAAIIAVRQVITRGIRFGARASARPG
jgi:uncharacterized membrane protein